MALHEIEPFIGRDCMAVIRCRACGREHSLRGVLTAGARGGEVVLSGILYNVDDVISISADGAEAATALPLSWALPYVGVALGLASWLRAAHR